MPGPAGRVAYTDTDDDNLVQFLAEYNPDGTGRLGNVLWKLLGDDDTAEALPWARRHPWQSWRDRYNKNSPYFDSRVKKYLKKHPTSKTIKKDTDKTAIEELRSTEIGSKRKRARDSDGVKKDEKRSKVTRDEAQDKGEGTSRRGTKKAKTSEKSDERVRGATEEEEADEYVLPKIGSDDYTAEIYEEGTDDDDEDEDEPDAENSEEDSSSSAGDFVESVQPESKSEVGLPETKGDALDSTTASKARPPIPDVEHGPSKLYPEITTIPTPHLLPTSDGEVPQHVPGAFKEPTETIYKSEPPKPTFAHIKRLYKASQAHTPPVSRPGSSTDATSPQLRPSTTLAPIIVSSSPLIPSQTLKPKAKAPQRLPSPAYSDSEDIFKTAPPSSLESPSPDGKNKNKNTTRTAPPKHVEGPFLNSIGSQRKIWRDSQDDDSDDGNTVQWPPARGRRRTPLPTQSQKITDKGKGKARVVEDDDDVLPQRIVAQAATKTTIASRTIKSTAESTEHPQDKVGELLSTGVSATTNSAGKARQSSTRQSSASIATIGSTSASRPHRASVDSTKSFESLSNTREASSSRPTALPTDRVTALRQESASAFIPRAPSSFVAPNDPFIDASTSASGYRGKRKDTGMPVFGGVHRRHTFGGQLPQSAPRLDLRTVGWGHRSGRSMPSHSHSHSGTAPISRRTSNSSRASISPSVSIPASDLEILCDMSLRQAIELISRNHGYQEEVTWNFWRQTKSLQITDEILKKLKEINETEGAKLIEEKLQQLESNADGSEPDLDQVDIGPVKSRALSEESVLSPPRRRSKKYSLQFTPGPIEDDRDSEYYPPETSRAAQFRRTSNHELVEVLKQDSRRTSGGALPSPFRLPRPSEHEVPQTAIDDVDTTLKKEDPESHVVDSELLMDADVKPHAALDKELHTQPEGDHIDLSLKPPYIWNDIEDDRILLSARANDPELLKLQERAGNDLIEEHVVRLFCR